MTALTTDSFFNGQIRVKQSRTGYRFSIDAVLLAAAAAPKPRSTGVDLGTGCGIIPLLIAHRHPSVRIYGVEIQGSLATLAVQNVLENGMSHRVRILFHDIKGVGPEMIPDRVDWVVSNPPFRKAATGRINPHHQRAAARHEITVTLSDVLEAGTRLLQKGGNFFIIYPAERMTDLLCRMRAIGLEPKWIRSVHSHTGKEAKRILVKGIKGGRPAVTILPPLVIYQGRGVYSDEVRKMLQKDVDRDCENIL